MVCFFVTAKWLCPLTFRPKEVGQIQQKGVKNINRLKQRIISCIILTMLLATIPSVLLMPSNSVSAAQVEAEFLQHIVYSPSGFGGLMHAYSNGRNVSHVNPTQVPRDARWVTIFPISSQLSNGMEIYYSMDGITTEKRFITVNNWNDLPAEARWLTVSNFDGAFGEGSPLRNQEFAYSVDGITVERGSEVPANALWATLSSYQTEWDGDLKTLDYSSSSTSFMLEVDPIQTVSLHSDAANPGYAGAGNEVSLTFTSLFPLQAPTVTLAGQSAPVTTTDSDGKVGRASILVSPAVSEGAVSFSLVYQDSTDGSQKTVTGTTDGSSVIIDHTPPSITLTSSPATGWTKEAVVISANVSDTASGIALKKWAEGERDSSYFENGGHIVAGNTISVSKSQKYTWYARDHAGNEAVQIIEITNIDTDPPSLTLEHSPTGWTSEAVQITAVASDDQSGLKSVKWAAGAQNEAFFQNGEGTEFSDSFSVNANGTYTVYAEDQAGNEIVQQITIRNLDTTSPVISLTPSTTATTKENIIITADISDSESGVALRKWAAGDQDVSYFLNEGTRFEGQTFIVSENGTYTVYAKDNVGNEQVEKIEIRNLFKTGSTVTLSSATTTWTNEPILIQAQPVDNGSGIAELKWASGNQDLLYFKDAGIPLGGATEFAVNENGWYTVYLQDNAGYEALASIEVTNFDDEKPTINQPTLSPATWTNGSITITVSAQDNTGVLSLYKWIAGEQNESFFQNGGGTAFSDSFTVDENGIYTIYVEDAAGNGTVRTFHVSTIDKDVPAIQLSVSTELPTNQNVTVTADVSSASPVLKQKWALGEQPLSYFDTEGADFNDTFDVELNGLYTVFAEDAAGNRQVATIEITNIFKEVPVIQVTLSPAVPTQDRVTLNASITSQSPVTARKLALGQHDVTYFQTEGEAWSDQLEVLENGWVSYYVQDAAGNETVKQVEIANIDREKPVITLLGQDRMSIVTGSDFEDPGAMATDNLDGDLSEHIVVSGHVNTQVVGEYSLRYNVTDAAGNSAEEVIRTVIVLRRSGGGGGGGTTNPGQGDGNPPPEEEPEHPEEPDPDRPEEPLNPDDGDSCSTPTPCDSENDVPPVFTDIQEHWAGEAIRQLAAADIIKGYVDGTFKPERQITRAEFASLLVNSLGLEKKQDASFRDTRDHWARDAIAAAKDHGIISGYSDMSFGPDDPLTREQMALMIVKAYSLTAKEESDPISFHDSETLAAWAKEAVHIVADNQIMVGFPGGHFRPEAFSSRAESAVVLHRIQLLMNDLAE